MQAMKKYILGLLFGGLVMAMCVQCARYDARSLAAVPLETNALPADGLIVAAKIFSKSDCKRYLDRDVISKGYQPIQLYIENVSDHTYLFSSNRVNLPLVSPDEVAKKVHTSTIGRITSYGAAALLATPLFIIPAVVDGYQSSKANDALDEDFATKSAKDQIIPPFSYRNMLLFVPKKDAPDLFVLTLLDEETLKPKRLLVRTKKS